MRAFGVFFDPGFHFCFQSFRSICLNAFTLNFSCMWAWSLLIYLGLFGQFMPNIVCQKIGTQSIENVKFCIFLEVIFLRLMYFNQYLNTFVRNLSTRFLQLISVFSRFIFHFSLLRFQSKFRGKKQNIENTKLDPITRKVFFRVFRVAVNFSKNFTKCRNFYSFFRANTGKIQF